VRLAAKFILKPFTAVPTRLWGNFLLASVLAMSLDIAAEKIIESEGTPSIAQSIFNMTGLYQRIVASPRNPFPRYIAIVSIDPSSEKHSVPSSHNVCAQREFLARLIERIAIASPDVIVVDKDFLPDECDENRQRTAGHSGPARQPNHSHRRRSHISGIPF